MQKRSISGLILLTMLAASLFLIIVPTTQAAYSAETTGLSVVNFDNSQQTYARVGSNNVFAVDNMILVYADNGALTGTLTYPAFSVSGTRVSTTEPSSNASSIYAFNSTHIIATRLMGWVDGASSSPDTLKATIAVGWVNLNTMGYTSIYTGYTSHTDTGSFINTNGFSEGLGIYASTHIMVNKNGTGTFYYSQFSAYMNSNYAAPAYRCIDIISYLGSVQIGGVVSFAYAEKSYTGAITQEASLIRNSVLVIDPGTYPTICPENYAFVVSANAWAGGNRANIYKVSFVSAPFGYSYVGVTTLDDTYGGMRANGATGFVYLMNVAAVADKIQLWVTYSMDSGDNLGISRIQFNATSVGQVSRYADEQRNGGVLTSDSTTVRPFATKLGIGGSYTADAIFSIGYWRDYSTPDVENLVAIDYAYTQGGSPEITYSNFYRAWDEAHIYPYNSCQNYGGFQPLSCTVALYLDMTNGKAKAEQISIFSND